MADRTSHGRGVLGAFYAGLTTCARPLIELILTRRQALGREDPHRINERKGLASIPRPKGPLLWIHAASIGEAISVKRLIARLLESYPALHILVTTGT
ncbi:MAG TPA: glycosyltransferase N-terminal domain-containing protein, partial [Alphaproteobacteria bacterium]|nr:glycosyltransferase N-terminal domain-containing protein [Alphaproteobacteria bacterium]